MKSQLQLVLKEAIYAFQGGNFDKADLILQQVLKNDINGANTIFENAINCIDNGRIKDALEIFELLNLCIKNEVQIPYNLGCLYIMQGNYQSAYMNFYRALEISPDDIASLVNCAGALHELKRFEDAIFYFNKAISLDPNYAEAWCNKGNTLLVLKQYADAIAHYDRALSLKIDYAEAWSSKGNVLYEIKRYDEAIIHQDKALSLKPDYAEAWSNKGVILQSTGRVFDARVCLEKALELKPDLYWARWAKLFISTPAIFLGGENLQELRKKFSLELEQLDKWFFEENLDEAYEVVGSIQPFYLTYQELNNKELLSKYGQLCYRLMNHSKNFNKLHNVVEQKNKKIKLGIVGDQIYDHSVWNAITKGLVFNLDASKFEIHIFHLGSIVDDETHSAKARATTFTNKQASILEWTKAIIEKNVDVLFYPEIGIDSLTVKLACLRLAPLQIVSWGHPQTTGLPTVDYYFSAELFEGASSEEAYTENLVKLPNLGTIYSKLSIVSTKFDFESFGISPNEPILICPGTPYKFAPQYDWILVEIAKRLGKCKLIFFNFENNNLSKILKTRLEKAFHEANLVFDDYVVFIPWLKKEYFYGLMECADVFLDTIGFSGFNTAMQAIDCALPIVAKEGRFMRGRFASGILKRMSMPELIANTDEIYIELVIRLVRDKSFRNQVVEKIIEMRDILYEDSEPIHFFENFLLSQNLHQNKP